MTEEIEKAAETIEQADALLITAGAGLGVDSGLPDFRGVEGFWNAYPPYRKLGVSFVEMANPDTFESDPAFGWGFYGHRMNLYRETEPHAGFGILKGWAHAKPDGYFVMTSNVDGHFQRSGFDEDCIYEVHGSIHYLQCTASWCQAGIWTSAGLDVQVDEETMKARLPLPTCESCGRVARPNILMFGDGEYVADRNREQEKGLNRWLREVSEKKVAIVELGAGTAVPTVRIFSEDAARRRLRNATLIRINPREPEAPKDQISIAGGALEALTAIDRCLH